MFIQLGCKLPNTNMSCCPSSLHVTSHWQWGWARIEKSEWERLKWLATLADRAQMCGKTSLSPTNPDLVASLAPAQNTQLSSPSLLSSPLRIDCPPLTPCPRAHTWCDGSLLELPRAYGVNGPDCSGGLFCCHHGPWASHGPGIVDTDVHRLPELTEPRM